MLLLWWWPRALRLIDWPLVFRHQEKLIKDFNVHVLGLQGLREEDGEDDELEADTVVREVFVDLSTYSAERQILGWLVLIFSFDTCERIGE
jgi:hypothetical protein